MQRERERFTEAKFTREDDGNSSSFIKTFIRHHFGWERPLSSSGAAVNQHCRLISSGAARRSLLTQAVCSADGEFGSPVGNETSLEATARRDEPLAVHATLSSLARGSPGSAVQAGPECREALPGPRPARTDTADPGTAPLGRPQHAGNINYTETGSGNSNLALLPL